MMTPLHLQVVILLGPALLPVLVESAPLVSWISGCTSEGVEVDVDRGAVDIGLLDPVGRDPAVLVGVLVAASAALG